MKQKYLLLSIILFVFLVFITSLSVFAVTPNLELTPSTQSLNVGSQATINVVVEEVTNLRGATVTLNFDASKLQYASSADGGFVPGAFLPAPTVDNINGSVILDLASLSSYASGTGTIMTVVFERIATGDTNITFGSTTLRDKDNITITHTKGSGCLITFCIGDFGGPDGFPDNHVDFEDLMIFALAYGSTPSDINWNPACDLYPDGKIEFEDLMIFAMHYGDDCGCTFPSPPTLSDPGTSLPSPANYTVSWSEVTEATSYILQEATSPDFSGAISYPVPGTSKDFSHTVITETTYYYRVTAVNDCGQSSWSNVEDIVVGVGPTVTTQAATNLLTTSATANGIVTSGGGANITERGFEYGLIQTPTWSVKETGTDLGTGAFSQNISGLTEGILYYIRAYAKNNNGSGYGSWVSFTTDISGMNIPTLNDPGTSLPSGTSFTVTWSDESGSGATKYTLQEDVLSDFSRAQNYVLTETSKSFGRIVDSDTTFYYRVRSENDTEQSAWSNTVDMLVTPISPPDTPVINDPGTSVSSGIQYTVTWSDESGSGANHYQLQEATAADFSGAQNYSLVTTSKSFTHNTFENTTYYYRVVAENTTSSQYSDWSNSVDITINGDVPGTPTLNDLGTVVDSGISYTVTWSDESGSGATSYRLQEDIVDTFSSAQSYTTSNNFKSFTHSVLSDTTYYYRVAAVNSNGQSGWSTIKSKIIKAVELAEWTVMIYLNGDNALESQVWDDLTEMETVGSKNGVNIIAQMDYASTPGTFRYFVTGSTQGSSKPYYPDDIVSSLSEQNMAEPAVLSDFVNWATSSFPANKYLLILRGTGEGWKGLLEDTSSSDKMTLQELVQGLSGINSHIDILGLDASCMQMTEVVYAIGDGLISPPDYMVGSEEIIWDNGWDYYDILNELTFNYIYDPLTCADQMASAISYGDGCAPTNTTSAIDLPGFMSNAKIVIDDFANALKNSVYSSNIATARASAQSYTGHPEFKDLYHFGEEIWTHDVYDCYDQTDPAMHLVEDNAFCYCSLGLGLQDSYGLSIYLPDTPAGYDTEYNVLQLAQDTQWDEFLQNITTVVKPTVTTIGHDSVTETSATCYGRINSTGGERANRIGIEYQDLTSGGSILDKYQTGDYGDEDFSRGLINLTAGHTYQYRAYADNPTAGRGYGEWKEFTTIPEDPVMPEVSTYGTDQIGSTTATAHGRVTSTGGAIITERGFTYGLTESADTWTASETGSFGEDFFEINLSGLQSSTTYYIKAFATNIVGTDYGPWDMFTTTEGTPDPDAPDAPILDPGYFSVPSGTPYTISWSDVSGAGYMIEEATQADFCDAIGWSTGNTSWEFSHENYGDTYKTYYYRVAAVNSNGQSEWSDPVDARIESDPVTYRLLGVGISDYEHNTEIRTDLPAPVYDIRSIVQLYNHHKYNFVYRILEDWDSVDPAGLFDIYNAISDELAAQADANDISYFVFSGHGAQDSEGNCYLIPADTHGEAIESINVTSLASWLSKVEGTKVVLLSSCRSGGFIGKDMNGQDFNPEEFNENVINAFSSLSTRDNLSQSNFQVLTACTSNQDSLEFDPWFGDPYSYFIKYYREGCGYDNYTYPIPADDVGDKDGKVSLQEAFNYIKNNNPKLTEDVQIYPWDSDFPVMEY